MRSAKRIGVLAVQGDVEAHALALDRLGVEPQRVLHSKDLDDLDALVLPGGESTTVAKGLDRLELWAAICSFAAAGKGVLGTCAGAILLSKRALHPSVKTLGLLDVVAERNAYGTQVDSFAVRADGESSAGFRDLRCIFIRAPILSQLGPEVEVLVRVDGHPVLVRQGSILASTFHPELTDDLRVHSLLL